VRRGGRVLRIITRLNIGGPAIQAIDLTRELERYGFETRLIHGSASPEEGHISSVRSTEDLPDVFVKDLVRRVSPVKDLKAFWRTFQVLRNWRPDIVHTHTAKAGAIGRAAALLYNATSGRHHKARLVHTYHGHVFEGYFSGLSTQFFLHVERFLGRRTDAIIAISAEVKSAILKTYGIAREDQVRLVHLGFDLDRLLAIDVPERRRARAALNIPNDCITVTTVGRLTAIKHQTLFLDLAARLVRARNEYRFLIAGDGELKPALEAEAARRQVEPYVRFLGWRSDLETIYGASDIFVLTSRSEGTPVALIEAMAAGVPAVSTDVGGVRDVICSDELGTLVPSDDPGELTSAVERLIGDAERRRTIARAARSSVRAKFTLSRLVADVAQVYEELLKCQPNSRSTT
jgi:glycosyltransferase involved in cell wall biosynthesis